ncbi:hypothetical protein Ciccas_003209 [Cichlidogyrus casuarinus]|uniref:Delta-aminolevulinic acid dehydratase n=1 Tax=Cichlidogyrus casuarinus TaxID=1844966 RepID=A0ABD2QF09_9PLAT
MYPLFISHEDDAYEDILSLPEQKRVGLNNLEDHLKPLIKLGLSSVLLFGVIPDDLKSADGSFALDVKSPVPRAIIKLREKFPDLQVAADVCLCGYTSHGHCGILFADGTIDNEKSCTQLAKVSLAYARAGAHIIAPSDMMDGRVASIKSILMKNNFHNVAIMSYSAKFASSLYGPFRDAAKSAPGKGDRKGYQLPPGAKGLAMRAVERDIKEGADILMVKPGLPYLDILESIRQRFPDYTLAVYHVSGEYAMLWQAAKVGAIDLEAAAKEILLSFRRAGATIIISYMTPYLLGLDFDNICT